MNLKDTILILCPIFIIPFFIFLTIYQVSIKSHKANFVTIDKINYKVINTERVFKSSLSPYEPRIKRFNIYYKKDDKVFVLVKEFNIFGFKENELNLSLEEYFKKFGTK